jgi:hypothetical protein
VLEALLVQERGRSVSNRKALRRDSGSEVERCCNKSGRIHHGNVFAAEDAALFRTR